MFQGFKMEGQRRELTGKHVVLNGGRGGHFASLMQTCRQQRKREEGRREEKERERERERGRQRQRETQRHRNRETKTQREKRYRDIER